MADTFDHLEDALGQPFDMDQAPLDDDELVARGMVPVRAFVRTKASGNALRQQRKKEKQEAEGLKQLNVVAPIDSRDTLKELAEALTNGTVTADQVRALIDGAAATRAEAEAAAQEADILRAENEIMQRERDQLRSERDELKHRINNVESWGKGKEQDLARTVVKLDAAQQAYQLAAGQLEKANAQADAFRAELIAVRDDYAAAAAELNRMRGKRLVRWLMRV